MAGGVGLVGGGCSRTGWSIEWLVGWQIEEGSWSTNGRLVVVAGWLVVFGVVGWRKQLAGRDWGWLVGHDRRLVVRQAQVVVRLVVQGGPSLPGFPRKLA